VSYINKLATTTPLSFFPLFFLFFNLFIFLLASSTLQLLAMAMVVQVTTAIPANE
jgi:hypothetical protein